MDISIFTDKANVPKLEELNSAIGVNHKLWHDIVAYAQAKYQAATDEWYYSGAKYGWNFRVKDKK